MEDQRWLRLIIFGLIIAALAVGYFLLTGRFTSKSTKVEDVNSGVADVAVQSPSPDESSVLGDTTQISQASPTPASAYDTIAQRSKGGVTELPKTGSPIFFYTALSASAAYFGWSLRRFPK